MATKRSRAKPPSDEAPRSESPYRKPGRPPFKPTQQQIGWVKGVAMFEPPLDFIARTMPGGPISIKTLMKNFGDTIKFAKINAISQVAMSLVRAALTPGPGQVRAQIFYLKSVGWPNDNSDARVEKSTSSSRSSRAKINTKRPSVRLAARVRRVKFAGSEERPRLPSADEIEKLRKLLAKS